MVIWWHYIACMEISILKMSLRASNTVAAVCIHSYNLQHVRCSWMFTAKKFNLCFPRKRTARPQSQFPQSCVCERFIYSPDRSPFFTAAELGLGTEFRYEKIPRNRLGMVSVIPRKKVLLPRHSEFRGRANSEARNGTERSGIPRKNEVLRNRPNTEQNDF